MDIPNPPDPPTTPHIPIQTSPGHYQDYFLVTGMPIEDFDHYQLRLVKDYGSDPNAKDLTQVLRLAGFPHHKVNSKKGLVGTPHKVRIVYAQENARPWTLEEVRRLIAPVERESKPVAPQPAPRNLDP